MSIQNVHRSIGLTLVELLVVLAITIIMLTLSASSFSTLLQREQGLQAISTFSNLFRFARTMAVQYQAPVTVCALDSASACNRDWDEGREVVVFIDNNNNHRLEPGDNLLRNLDWPAHKGKVRWRASLGRRYITFLELGNTWQNGTLYYCPTNKEIKFARALVVSHTGRSYHPGDSNGDGIDENKAGRNLDCAW